MKLNLRNNLCHQVIFQHLVMVYKDNSNILISIRIKLTKYMRLRLKKYWERNLWWWAKPNSKTLTLIHSILYMQSSHLYLMLSGSYVEVLKVKQLRLLIFYVQQHGSLYHAFIYCIERLELIREKMTSQCPGMLKEHHWQAV